MTTKKEMEVLLEREFAVSSRAEAEVLLDVLSQHNFIPSESEDRLLRRMRRRLKARLKE